jgi:hypothetical protein
MYWENMVLNENVLHYPITRKKPNFSKKYTWKINTKTKINHKNSIIFFIRSILEQNKSIMEMLAIMVGLNVRSLSTRALLINLSDQCKRDNAITNGCFSNFNFFII